MICFEPPEEDCGNMALFVAPIGLTVSGVLCSGVFPVSGRVLLGGALNTVYS